MTPLHFKQIVAMCHSNLIVTTVCHAINEITSRYTSVLLYGYVAHELWEKQAIISITQARRGIKCKVNVKCLYSLV